MNAQTKVLCVEPLARSKFAVLASDKYGEYHAVIGNRQTLMAVAEKINQFFKSPAIKRAAKKEKK